MRQIWLKLVVVAFSCDSWYDSTISYYYAFSWRKARTSAHQEAASKAGANCSHKLYRRPVPVHLVLARYGLYRTVPTKTNTGTSLHERIKGSSCCCLKVAHEENTQYTVMGTHCSSSCTRYYPGTGSKLSCAEEVGI